MASNFKIFCHQKGDNLHIKLVGDFDGSSALELVDTLDKHHGKVRKVFVETCSLASIHPFGLQVFQNNCKMDNFPGKLIFTGKHRNEMALDGAGTDPFQEPVAGGERAAAASENNLFDFKRHTQPIIPPNAGR